MLLITLLAAAGMGLAMLPPLHPAQIWAIVWALAVGAYTLKLLPYLQLDLSAQVLIGGASLGFMGGALAGEQIGGKVVSRLNAPKRTSQMIELRIAGGLALCLTVLGLICFLLQVVHGYGLRAALVSSSDVRHAVEKGAFDITIKYVYAAVAASVLCGASAAIGPHRRRWALATGLAVLSTYFTTGRSDVVVATVSALCAYALARPSLPPKRSFVLAGCAVAVVAAGVFTIGGSLIGKTFVNSEVSTIESTFERHASLRPIALPYEYISAPIAAFGLEVELTSHLPRTAGCASFGYVCSILHHVGLSVEPVQALRPFTAPPLTWNTYTSLDAPLLDGGTLLVIPATLLAGIILGGVWAAARRRRSLPLVCYAALMPAIVTASGSDNFTAPLLLGAVTVALGSLLAARLFNRTNIWREPCAHHTS